MWSLRQIADFYLESLTSYKFGEFLKGSVDNSTNTKEVES